MEPVKDILRRRGSAMIGSETSAAEREETMLITPAGTPASIIVCTKYCMVSGVSFAGLIITVLPAASAGAILRVAMDSGKFHGVIRRHGPIGLCTVTIRLPFAGYWLVWPKKWFASSENHSR